MSDEFGRQIVHAAGIVFILLAYFMEKWVAVVLFADIVAFFFFYGELVRTTKKSIIGFRRHFLRLERKGVRPFFGALLFYLGCLVTFVLYPTKIAVAACCILAIGDSLSTIIGMKFGKVRIYNKRTIEGSLAFFVGAFLISVVFVDFRLALIGAFAGMLTELFSSSTKIKTKIWIIDDNLLIPIIAGAVMVVFSLVL